MRKISKKGFTMIELLVVIGIIGVLASLVLVITGNARDKTRDSKVRSQLSQMNSQSLLFRGIVGTGYMGEPVGSIVGPTPGGNPEYGTLFNDTTFSNNSLYLLANSLPNNTVMFYGWDGGAPATVGKWFFAASVSNGAFCVDWKNEKKEFVGTLTSDLDWYNAFPNANPTNNYSCN